MSELFGAGSISMKKIDRGVLVYLCYTFDMSYWESFIIEFFLNKFGFCWMVEISDDYFEKSVFFCYW